METALSDRADLAASEFTLKAAADSLKAAELASGITVDGTYALDYQITNDIGTRGSDSTVGLSASYPIFDGGERRGAVRVAKAARDQAFDTMLQTRLTVRTGVETAYAQRDQAATSVALGRAAVDAAQASYDSAVAGLKAGVNTEVDVSTAQAALTQAEFSYVGAIYTYFEADAALQRAMGALPTTTVHNSPFAK
jgi:outer membrane protein TolC